jgi:hypothetical protein
VLRTPITVTAAAAALALLTACGPVQMGAAATAGNAGISAATLSSEVHNLNQAIAASHGRVQLQFPASREPQAVLSWLLRFRVQDQLAVRRGIRVTPAESQQALRQAEAQARQSNGVPFTALAAANGLPPDLLPAYGRYAAIGNKLVSQLDHHKLPASQTALQALSRELSTLSCRAARSLNVKVNPQFGQFSYTQQTVVPGASALSAPEGGKPAQGAQPGAAC